MSEFLDKQYINMISPRLEGFSWIGSNTANFRCPICGDSKNNKRKRRGYIIHGKKGYGYCCHNCGTGMTFRNFLNSIAPDLSSMYKLDLIRNRSNTEVQEVKHVLRKQQIVSITELSIPISVLPEDHKAKQYVRSRRIPDPYIKKLFYTPNFGKMVEILTKQTIKVEDERLVIPFRTKDGKIFAFQGRSLDPKSDIRYITIKLDESIPKIYGLDTVDTTTDVYIVEGPIKSMFLRNSVAVAGATTSNIGEYIPHDNAVFCFDNEPRSPDIVDLVEDRINDGYKVVIWNDYNYKSKDIDDAIVKEGATIEEIEEYIKSHTFKGVKAKLEFAKWRKV